MKAITLYQPYATLMAIGAKTLETRSWKTNHTGQIAVHAAKTFPSWCKDFFWQEPIRSMLRQHGYDAPGQLPRGVVLSVHVLKGCYETPMIRGTTRRHVIQDGIDIILPPLWPESVFGDYSSGRYAWHMPIIEVLDSPIVARGMQRLWDWERL